MKRAGFKNTEHAREIHNQCVEQVEIVKGVIAAARSRVDAADHGLDSLETCDLYGALSGAYEAADKAWGKLSELVDLIPREYGVAAYDADDSSDDGETAGRQWTATSEGADIQTEVRQCLESTFSAGFEAGRKAGGEQ